MVDRPLRLRSETGRQQKKQRHPAKHCQMIRGRVWILLVSLLP